MTAKDESDPSSQFRSIRELVDHHAANSPHATFLIDPGSGTKITFRDLQFKVRSIETNITRHDVRPGQPVAYAADNSPEVALAILGILYGGFVATAINLVAGNSVISYVLTHSETKLIIANEAGLASLETPLRDFRNVPILTISSDLFDSEREPEVVRSAQNCGGLLMYTSGTTGQPKGVVLSHENLLTGGHNTALAHELSSVDCGMCVLPLYHINGLCVTLMGALVSGGSLVVPPRFSVSTFWSTMTQHKCTWFSLVPTQISYLLHQSAPAHDSADLSDIRFGRSASAPLSPDVQSAFEDKFDIPIIETMGLTESAAQILSNPLPPGVRKIGSAGIAFGNEVRIGDANQDEVSRNTEGEVLVRGSNVMQEYLKNQQATTEALTADGWLRTGDLGRMDADGYVYITGRLKELVIKGGENIAPREIDEALYSHSDVVEAAAFGRKCDRYGESIEAAVMISEGSSVTEKELIAICHSKLGAFKTPDRIYFLPELPKGPSGKIQRIKLAEFYN